VGTTGSTWQRHDPHPYMWRLFSPRAPAVPASCCSAPRWWPRRALPLQSPGRSSAVRPASQDAHRNVREHPQMYLSWWRQPHPLTLNKGTPHTRRKHTAAHASVVPGCASAMWSSCMARLTLHSTPSAVAPGAVLGAAGSSLSSGSSALVCRRPRDHPRRSRLPWAPPSAPALPIPGAAPCL
jgi:hypothetical protein